MRIWPQFPSSCKVVLLFFSEAFLEHGYISCHVFVRRLRSVWKSAKRESTFVGFLHNVGKGMWKLYQQLETRVAYRARVRACVLKWHDFTWRKKGLSVKKDTCLWLALLHYIMHMKLFNDIHDMTSDMCSHELSAIIRDIKCLCQHWGVSLSMVLQWYIMNQLWADVKVQLLSPHYFKCKFETLPQYFNFL